MKNDNLLNIHNQVWVWIHSLWESDSESLTLSRTDYSKLLNFISSENAIIAFEDEDRISDFAIQNDYPRRIEFHEDIRIMYQELFKKNPDFYLFSLTRSIVRYMEENEDMTEFIFEFEWV